MRQIKYIVIHHSLTKDTRTLSWRAIRAYHKAVRGWTDIGYHVGIEFVDHYMEVLIGRPWHRAGAHAPGRNRDSLGVCLVGDFNKRPPNAQEWTVAVDTVIWICKIFAIPATRVLGHREATKNRTCPGAMFDMDKFRKAVKRRLR